MSRMASRGARRTMRNRPGSGFTNASTVTRLGISCAGSRAGSPNASSVRDVATRRRPLCEGRIVLSMDSEVYSPGTRPVTGVASMQRRKLVLGGLLVALIAGLGIGQSKLQAAMAGRMVDAPMFEVDPFWPKTLPNQWLLRMRIGVGVDSKDRVCIVHGGNATLNQRTEAGADANPPVADCCRAAPPVLEFDPQGNLVNSWGGPSTGAPVWPLSNHGISIDDKDNVWIGGNGTCDSVSMAGSLCTVPGSEDSYALKFSHDGKYL